jgi:hypothetical protein
LAQHEIQCSGGEKELKLAGPMWPANIRIHGTMYRRIFGASDSVPLRYLIHDPKECDAVAQRHGLQKHLVRQLDTIVVPRNDHMRMIQRLARLQDPAKDASLVLSWGKGVDEVAGIVLLISIQTPGGTQEPFVSTRNTLQTLLICIH